jgi:hypothetical protein
VVQILIELHHEAGPHPLAPSRKNYREAARELAAVLKPRLAGEVRFDAGSRVAYAIDHSIYRAVPIGVIIPRNAEDVIPTVEACRRGVCRSYRAAAGRAFRGRPAMLPW